MSALDNLTVGDALVGNLNRRIAKLSEDEQIDRASRTLDALLTGGSAELEALGNSFDRELHNTTSQLQTSMQQSKEIYVTMLNKTALKLDDLLAPGRDRTRALSLDLLKDLEAKQEAKRRKAASLAGFRRSMTWRAGKPTVPTSDDGPKHPAVVVSEASALVLSLMICLVMGDAASKTHYFTAAPKIASVRMQPPRLTSDYSRGHTDTDSDMEQEAPWNFPAAEAPKASSTVATVEENGLRTTSLCTSWWRAMRGVVGIYFFSLGFIILNAHEDWASRALGIEPCDSASGADRDGAAASPAAPRRSAGVVRWEYDWERDAWVES